MPDACAPCAAGVALRAPGTAGSALAPPGREVAAAGGSSDKKIQEQDMRKIIEAVATVAVVIAAAFIWFALSAPGFTVDEASTVPIAAHQEVRRWSTPPRLPRALLTTGGHLKVGTAAPSRNDPAHRSHRLNRPSPEMERGAER